jgi:hypothetical protein
MSALHPVILCRFLEIRGTSRNVCDRLHFQLCQMRTHLGQVQSELFNRELVDPKQKSVSYCSALVLQSMIQTCFDPKPQVVAKVLRIKEVRLYICVQVSGLVLAFDPSRPPGHRIVEQSVCVMGVPLERKTKYRVGTKVYLLQGKDGYGSFADVRTPLMPLLHAASP